VGGAERGRPADVAVSAGEEDCHCYSISELLFCLISILECTTNAIVRIDTYENAILNLNQPLVLYQTALIINLCLTGCKIGNIINLPTPL
jgi:hypothetical protein